MRPVWPTAHRSFPFPSEVNVPGHNRQHYTGTYHARAARLRQAAYANPATICLAPKHDGTGLLNNGTICGRTLAQHRPGDTWDAGHVNAQQKNGPLQPEAASCNRSNGARSKTTRTNTTTRDW